MQAEVLIVGQGLAGSLLAWHLLQRNTRLIVVDDQHRHSASLVAAGLINPITGKRLVKSWNVEQCLPAAMNFYRMLETQWQKPVYHQKTILRLFASQQERELWARRRLQPDYQCYLGNAAGDGFHILQSGYLNTRDLLLGIRDVLRQRGCFIDACVDYEDITFHSQEVRWRHISAKRIIFCEGHGISNNPWFNALPLQPAQGEILTLKVAAPLPKSIINSGKWLLPIDAQTAKVGATFQWQPLDSIPTAKGKQELLDACQRLWPASPVLEVLDHACGVRPGTRDKKPFIGMHPRIPQIGVFNGFGAKGALLIPYYAERFANYLSGSSQLPEETDIMRFAADW